MGKNVYLSCRCLVQALFAENTTFVHCIDIAVCQTSVFYAHVGLIMESFLYSLIKLLL